MISTGTIDATLPETPDRSCDSPKSQRRQDDPEELRNKDIPALAGGKIKDPDRRDFQRPPRQKVPRQNKGRKECNAESTACHGVEKSVRSGDEEEKEQQLQPMSGESRHRRKHKPHCDQCQKQGKGKRMSESPVPQKRVVRDAIKVSHRVVIRKDGANDGGYPEPFGLSRVQTL